MKCPHCLNSFHEQWETSYLLTDNEKNWQMLYCTCPECQKAIIELGEKYKYVQNYIYRLVYPKATARTPIPPEVDDKVVLDAYTQSCLVLADSPMASAALSRRALQHILREKAGVKHADLASEIEEVVDSGKLPSDLSGNLDAVRHIGNFAAHPMKSKNSGEILEVEPGEAEWNLDVVEELMEYYFVRPARSLQKKIALNAKLKEAGKPELPL